MKYVISDLHGCFKEFKEMLKLIDFKENDELYIIGDIVDRGPDPIPLLQYIMKQKNMYVILGNHEDMMLNAIKRGQYNLWYYNGGEITNEQFKKLNDTEKKEIINWISNLPLMMELNVNNKDYILLHGGPNFTFKRDYENNHISRDVIWERYEYLNKTEANQIFPGKTFIIGHTPTFIYGYDNKMINCGALKLIDCGCVFGYTLSCVCLDTEKVYYIKSAMEK